MSVLGSDGLIFTPEVTGGPIDFPVDSVNGMTGDVVIPPYVLPVATATTIGGVKIGTAPAGQVMRGIDATGAPIFTAGGPAFAVIGGNNYLVAPNTLTKVVPSGVQVNTDGCYDANNGLFRAPVAGYYQISAAIGSEYGQDARSIQLNLLRSGSIYQQMGAIAPSAQYQYVNVVVSELMWFGVNDYAEIYVMQSTSNNLYMKCQSFSGFLARGA
jgi:hypothetical protein